MKQYSEIQKAINKYLLSEDKRLENYDYIIAGGKAWNPYYCQSFHTTEDKLVNCGLPRIDHLLQTAEANRKAVIR